MPTTDSLRLLRFVPEAARRVLDFGCGSGARLRALADRGANALGVDTPEALGGDVPNAIPCASLDAAELPQDAPFDCIVSDGALARLRDPARVLARLRSVLAPGGLLVLSAPNVQYHGMFTMLVEGRWSYAPAGPIPHAQIRYYTGFELHKLLTARGFGPPKLMALEVDPAETFPLGGDGYVRAGRLSVGPLTEAEHAAFLVREYLVLAQAPHAEHS